jgi:hypothetical protein
MPNAKKKKDVGDALRQQRYVKVALKSIRNPKFSVALEDIQTSDSILMVKERLLGDPDGPLADMNYQVSNIKFLVSGKVISDSRSLEDVAGEEPLVSFTVLLTQPSDEPEIAPPSNNLEINENLWADIKGVIVKRLGESQGEKVYTRLKSSW